MAKYRTKTSRTSRGKEKELVQQLQKNLGLLFLAVALILVTFGFFGPKLGAVFSIFSKYRNDTGPGDIIPPAVPIFSQVPEATKDEKITLNGVTDPSATVRLFVNGPEAGKTTADNDGKFTFADVEISKNTNIIFAKAEDENGNVSEKSKIINTKFDDEEPEIEITEPTNGETVKNLNERVMVKGTVNEEAEVTINGRRAVINPDNSFELLIGVNERDVEIKVEATDKAGNTSEEKIYIKYEKKSS